MIIWARNVQIYKYGSKDMKMHVKFKSTCHSVLTKVNTRHVS